MTKFFNKLKKPYFVPFSPFLRQNLLPQKIQALSLTISHGFLIPCQNLENVNDAIPRKRLWRRTDGWKVLKVDRQTLFYRTQELKDHTQFWQYPPKIIEVTFSFPEFVLACRKPFHSIYSFVGYSKL